MVKFYRIDLNKEGDRAGGKKAKVVMYSLAAVWLIAAGVIWGMTNGSEESLDKRINNRKNAIRDLETKIEEITSENPSEQVSEADVRSLVNIWKNRLLWTSKLTDLSSLLSKDMMISNLLFNGRYLTITGFTKIVDDQKEFQLVADFIENLKASPSFNKDFDEVIFKNQRKHNVQGTELLSFEIQCILK